jgi:hypothetical protein
VVLLYLVPAIHTVWSGSILSMKVIPDMMRHPEEAFKLIEQNQAVLKRVALHQIGISGSCASGKVPARNDTTGMITRLAKRKGRNS